jgi:predicted membrane protein DUF2069
MPLRLAAILCHTALIAALGASVLSILTPGRLGLALLLVAPLLATLPGLARAHRKTLQSLAVLLVAYVGGASVEVVARSGQAALLNVALLTAGLELGLTLALIRRGHLPRRGARE